MKCVLHIYFLITFIVLPMAIITSGCPQPLTPVVVPNVVGQTVEAAQSAIIAAELTVGSIIEQEHDTITVGDVLSQNPGAGTEVNAGSAVDLVVSIGSGMVSVPNVVGQTVEAAQSAIVASQLTVGTITEEYHDSIPAGQVISQEPDAGIMVTHSTAINLVISASELDENEVMFLLPGGVQLSMVWIPPGSFIMGSREDEQDSFANEGPQREVAFAEGFWMGKYPITQAQWQAFMADDPSHFKGDNRPVERVTWDDIRQEGGFLEQLNAVFPGYNFRLPTEAEWEYACRAGTSTRFYWGDDPDYSEIDDYAWHRGNSNTGNGRETHEVGLKLPNAWGLYDMSGNVWEWCEDDWHINYIGAPIDGSAWINEPRSMGRLLRGGSWYHEPEESRAASRNNRWSFNRYNRNGFRIVCEID